MAPTKSAGRVSIRVLPDSTRFRDDLKKTLDRIEKMMKVQIQVNPIFDKRQLAELKRQIEALQITIRPDIDLDVPTAEIAKIKEAIEAMDPMVEINAKANTAAAAARIRALTNDRMVQIWPILHKAAVNNFTKHLAAISGASFISQEIQKGMHFLRTIDQHAVQLSKQAIMLGGVATLVNGVVSSVLALGDGLISTLGILTVAPALASSMAIAVAVFSVALKDMKEVLGDLGPAFTQLATDMSFKFWDEAAQPIREMVNELMPTLSEKMILASTSMGKLTGQIANSYKQHVTVEKFAIMFDRVLESMETVRDAVDPIIESFAILGMHGTKYLNRLSESIVKVTEDFRNWIKASDENGNLTRWTEEAIVAFKDLGGMVTGVWRIFGSLNSAIQAAGGPTLATLHQNLDNLASMMQSPMFQQALTGVLRGMFSALEQIGTAIAGIGPDLASMAPTIELAFVSVGSTISILIGYLGDIMSHPAVRGGLLDLFTGINKAVRALSPAIEPFSLALGSLLSLLGTVVENVGHLVSTILTEWGPSLQRLSDVFDTLAEPLRLMLEEVVKALTPAIKILIDDAIIPLLEWIRDHLIPAMGDFARDAAPLLKGAIELVADTIEKALPVLTKLTDFFKDNSGQASKFKDSLNDIGQLMDDPAGWLNKPRKLPEFDWGEFMQTPISFEPPPGWDGGGDPFSRWVADFFIAAGEGIADSYLKFCEWLDDQFVKAWEFVTGGALWDFMEEDWTKFISGLKGMSEDLGNWWDGIWNDFRPAEDNEKLVDWQKQLDTGNIKPATAGINIDLGALKENMSRWWTDVSAGWGTFWTGFSETASTKWGEFKTGISEWWMGLKEGFVTWWEDIKIGWGEFWVGFAETAAIKWEEFKVGIGEWWAGLKEGFATWWAEVRTGWDEFWGGIGESTSLWWTTIKETIATFIQEIRDNIQAKLEEMGVDTTNGWTIIRDLTALAWEGIKAWLAQKWQEIKDNIKNWLSGLGIDVGAGWSNIKTFTSQKWSEIKQTISDKWNEIVNFVPGKIRQFTEHVRWGFESAKQAARDKMEELKQGVKQKIEDVINWVRDLPNKMRNAMTGQSLESSGSSLIQGFKDGMVRKANEAYEAAKSILQKIRNLFPASPAKEGPFSGKGWTPYSGAALVDGFAEGMESRMASTVKVAHRMASGVGKELSNVKYSPIEAQEELNESRSGNVSLKIYNPIAEPTSRTIARASSMIKLGGKP